jgi:hypothetical protein
MDECELQAVFSSALVHFQSMPSPKAIASQFEFPLITRCGHSTARFVDGNLGRMMRFTKLELAVLRSIFSETPEVAAELERQLSSAAVKDRENSGAGFFTTIAVPDDATRVSTPRVLGHETHARIVGLELGLGFVLFMEDGKLDVLEGFNWGSECTRSFDLNNLNFEVFKAPITHTA